MYAIPVLLWTLTLVTPTRLDDQAEGKALVAKAVQALGGEAALAKAPAVTLKAKAKILEDGNERGTLSGDLTAQGLAQYRAELTMDINGRMETVVLVINGDKAWVRNPAGATMDLPKEVGDVMRPVFFAARAGEVLPLAQGEGFQLAPLGEVQIDGKPAVGVRVQPKDGAATIFYLDKASGLPVKSEVRAKEPNGQEATFEFLFSDYKDFGGVKHFTKMAILRDGKRVMDAEFSEVKPRAKLEDSHFGMP